jgi:hypothetical protein
MALIDDLNERRENALAEIEGCKKQLAEVESELAGLRDAVSDLNRAIAALEPAPIPEPDDASEFAEPDAVTLAYEDDEGICAAAALREEAQRAAATELTADVEPEAVASGITTFSQMMHMDAAGYEPASTDDGPVEWRRKTVPQPECNEPEGYAPVTNPDADAQAKALDYYSPEKIAERNRFNPFAVFKREEGGL